MNPLDAICDRPRNDAVCVSNLKSAKAVDKALLAERPDVKIFLPFRFHFYKPKDLFKENTYNNFLGKNIRKIRVQNNMCWNPVNDDRIHILYFAILKVKFFL